jgi:hypothetical protein
LAGGQSQQPEMTLQRLTCGKVGAKYREAAGETENAENCR